MTSLHWASWNGHEACVATLIAAGADPNAVTFGGHTPLYWAARAGYDTVCKTLTKVGANPNTVNSDGNTPLHQAACNGYDTVCKTLLAAGADPNVVNNNNGETPLQLAAEKGHKECAKIVAVRVLVDRALTNDEWDLIPPGSDLGYLLPVVMARDGRNAAAKLVSRLPEGKRKVLETVAMCMSRVVLRDLVERIAVQCVCDIY
jgi:hypothetical protein